MAPAVNTWTGQRGVGHCASDSAATSRAAFPSKPRSPSAPYATTLQRRTPARVECVWATVHWMVLPPSTCARPHLGLQSPVSYPPSQAATPHRHLAMLDKCLTMDPKLEGLSGHKEKCHRVLALLSRTAPMLCSIMMIHVNSGLCCSTGCAHRASSACRSSRRLSQPPSLACSLDRPLQPARIIFPPLSQSPASMDCSARSSSCAQGPSLVYCGENALHVTDHSCKAAQAPAGCLHDYLHPPIRVSVKVCRCPRDSSCLGSLVLTKS